MMRFFLQKPSETPRGLGVRQSPAAFDVLAPSENGRGLPHSKTPTRPQAFGARNSLSASLPDRPRVAIACGGTGGHLFPGLAVAASLQARGCDVTLLVSSKDVDQQAVQAARGAEIVTLPAAAWQRGSRFAFVRGFAASWRASRRHFRIHPPRAVLAMGGFTSAPPVLAGWSVGAKTFLHESNTIPGRANRWLARWADQALVGFPQAAPLLRAKQTLVTGTPVRRGFRRRDSSACRKALGLDPTRPVVLVMGGSQGARGINKLILSSLPQLAARGPHWQWLHLTGPHDGDEVRAAYARLGLSAKVHPFLLEMEQVLGAATVAVNRAGASSLAEFAAMQLPSVLVPLPHAADNHQFHNARAFAKTGAAALLEQASATPEKVAELIRGLVENSEAQRRMQLALAAWHTPMAAERIAGFILATIGERTAIAAQSEISPEWASCGEHTNAPGEAERAGVPVSARHEPNLAALS